MKKIDRFLWNDIKKIPQACDVAYYLDDIQTYNNALASTRMRCYDMVMWLEKQGIRAELYKPFKHYKVVFFIKTRSDKAVRTARKLYSEGVKLYFDPYCEFLTDEKMADNWERKNILELVKNMDVINACSPIQQEMFSKYHSHVNFIGDSVHEEFFAQRKIHDTKEKISLLYCGYSKKTLDTLEIRDVIRKLQDRYHCEMILLTNEDPHIDAYHYRFIPYHQKEAARQFTVGDIMIAPRPMDGIETLSHSNTKIAYPMAVGLPVAASPVPSYLDSPAVICTTEEEWYQSLEQLIMDASYRKELGEKGRSYIWDHYSVPKIGEKYKKMILEDIL